MVIPSATCIRHDNLDQKITPTVKYIVDGRASMAHELHFVYGLGTTSPRLSHHYKKFDILIT